MKISPVSRFRSSNNFGLADYVKIGGGFVQALTENSFLASKTVKNVKLTKFVKKSNFLQKYNKLYDKFIGNFYEEVISIFLR